ncbi:MAG TPA: mechanosensitive ion channel family protein [Chlorobaculum sp.]|nr:mechanosensitive ion channel family protein [Chlorobaculum sp.]
MQILLSSFFRVFVCCVSMLLIQVHTSLPLFAVPPDSTAVGGDHPQPVPVMMWNRPIVVFRSNYEELTPSDRAKYAIERLNQMPADLPEYRVAAVDVIEAGKRLAWIKVNGRIMFGVLEGEEDVQGGETYELYKQRTVKAVSEWLYARKAQYEVPLLLQALGLALLFTMLGAISAFAVSRSVGWALLLLRRLESDSFQRFVIAGNSVGPYIASFLHGLLKILEGVVLFSIFYLWLTSVLSVFPYTEPWARELSGFLFTLLSDFGHGLLVSIPAFFTIAVIFFVTRLVVRVITAFFKAVEDDTLQLRWFEPETAKATRRIIVVLIWIFALIIAYPLIPGSQTKAFQGVSVFLGLMLSLGSAGLVGQLIGGVVAVYTRAFQRGDYVRIGEHEGVVEELGILAAKIVTIRKEEVTIPNALLMSSTTVNYTRQSRRDGAIVATGVTIGYDAPWRQVHAMLLLAAERTKGIRSTPKPFVLQKALSDFYVEYTLMNRIDRPEERYYILSELHGHIQDVFNEYGVQIMSPNFVMQPEKEVVVPKEQWYADPGNAGTEQGATSAKK